MADIGTRLHEMWEDQRAFNLLLRQPPKTEDEMAEQVRDFILFTESELHELLRALPWKKHRKVPILRNDAHLEEEGIDVLKCVMSLLQIIGVESLDQVVDAYWRKTAVVRQRYREEWVSKLNGPCVVIDIDNVLCDYVTGLCDWIPSQFGPPVIRDDGPSPELLARIDHLRATGGFINAESLGLPQEVWQMLKHQFRVSGLKRTLPVFQDAYSFLFRMRADGHQIVLLTSRPIDRYPNIFTDTILWLNANRLPYDFVWWSLDKAERIVQMKDLQKHIRFAVDDDKLYVDQFASIGVPTYWLQRHNPIESHSPRITTVQTLSDVDRY